MRAAARSAAVDDEGGTAMTLIWFVIWLFANVIGDTESLIFAPVNWWAGALLLAIALDLSRQHAPRVVRGVRRHVAD